jgi:hypothetical protein
MGASREWKVELYVGAGETLCSSIEVMSIDGARFW